MPRCHRFQILPLLLLVAAANADEITPVGVLATSEFGAIDVFGDGNFSSVFVLNLIDGSGLEDLEGTPDLALDDYHDNDAGSSHAWHSGDRDAGIPGGIDGDEDPLSPPLVSDQILEFDLGGTFALTHAHIWQQNQANLFGESLSFQRGVDAFEILVSTSTQGSDFRSLGDFNLESEDGLEAVPAQVFQLSDKPNARRVRFQLKTAHSELPREFVGLSEVRFEGIPNNTPGDFDGDGQLTAADVDLLTREVRAMTNAAEFDLNADALVDQGDRDQWVEQLKNTYFGDANLDGQFNSTDFVVVFQSGQYEDNVDNNSAWASGDWNGDGDFNSTDFVIAFQRGGYEQGPRADVAVNTVPEPSGWLFLAVSIAVLAAYSRLRAR